MGCARRKASAVSTSMRLIKLRLLLTLTCIAALGASAQPQTAQVSVSFTNRLGPMEIHKMALGQGGLSEEPMWDNRVAEIRALKPGVIRLFVQEYFDLLPERGRYHFDTLDRSVATILATGSKPLMCLCFKPRALYPAINQNIVEPNDYAETDHVVCNLVRQYRERAAGMRYCEAANEAAIAKSGGCSDRSQP